MKKIFGNKKFTVGIIAVLIILIALIAFSFCAKKDDNIKSENSTPVFNTEDTQKTNKENENSEENKSQTNKQNGVKTNEIPYLEEGETLEDAINDFNSLPEGEEKEKAREKLEKIFEHAEKNSPANLD